MKHFLLTFFATLLALTALAAESVPYSSLIDGDNWTIIDANNDKNGDTGTWISANSSELDGSGCNKGVKYYYSKNQADDWIISPAIHLEKGKKYKLTHKGKLYSNYTVEKYSLYYSTSPDPSSLKQDANLIFTSVGNISNTSWNTLSNVVEPTEDGDYYFGFYCFSDADKWYVFITDFNITSYDELPGNVSDLKIEPGDQGVMKATLSWKWPELNDLRGTLSTSLTGARIHRTDTSWADATDGNKIATITLDVPAEPGTTYVWEDNTFPEDATAKKYYYFVIPINENGECPSSVPTSESCWIGADSGVGNPTNLSVTLDEDNPNVVLVNFDPPKGTNGGWIDLSKVGYNIYRYNGSSVTSGSYVTLEENYQGSLPYRDTKIDKLGKYSYGIKVVVDGVAKTGNNISAGTIMAGPVPSIPYQETFDSSASLDVFTSFKGSSGTSSMNRWSGTTISNNYAASVGTGSYYTVDEWLVTPGIQMQGGKTYIVKFDSWGSQSSGYSMDKYGEISVYVGQGSTQEAFTEASAVIPVTNNVRETKEARFKIEEDGIYNIAFRDFVSTSMSRNYVTVYLDDLTINYLPVAPLAPTNVEANVGNQGSMKVDLKWVNPTLDNEGNELNSIDKIEVYRSVKDGDEQVLVTTLTGKNPGETVEYSDENIPADGFYTYIIKPYLGNETYDFAIIDTDWVGHDTYAPVKNVEAKMSSSDFNNIEVNFVAEGANGGYINHDNMTFKISRMINGNNNSEVVIKEGLKYSELPFVDQNVPGLNAYVYKVFVSDLESDNGISSNKVVGGGTAALPYSNTFDAVPSIDLFTMSHFEGGNYDWIWNNSALAYKNNVSTSQAVDSWAMTPPIEMKEGGNYTISFNPRLQSLSYKKQLKVYVVNSMNPEEWNEPLFDQEIATTSSIVDPNKVEFVANENGVYYVVFRCMGTYGDTYFLYVDNLTIERTDRAPLAVENLKVAYDPTGAMKATVTWTNPTMDNKGDALSKIDKVEVLREGKVVGTIETNEVGGDDSYEDTIEEGAPGFYRYSVVAYLEDVPGLKAEEVSVWVGQDELKAPGNVTGAMNYDGYPEIKFDAVTSGKNGGYVDVNAIKYRVYRGTEKIGDEIATTHYVDMSEDLVAGTSYSYSVSAYVGEVEGEKSAAVSVKYAPAINLSYTPDFSDDSSFALWDLRNFSVSTSTSSAPYVPALKSGTNSTGTNRENTWAITPAFKAEQGEITLSLSTSVESSSHPQDLEVYLITNPENPKQNAPVATSKGISNQLKSGAEKPEAIDYVIDIPANGVYYLGFYKATQDIYYVYIHQSDIVQSSVADPNTPAAPASISVALQEDGSRKITFDAVTTNTMGDDLDAEITYTLYLDGEELVKDLTETTYNDSSEVELAKHVYSVKAVNGEYESKLTVADGIVFGAALELPYKPDYSTAETFEYWNFINQDGGTSQWKYNETSKRLETGFSPNIWAITPPLAIQKGKGKISLRYRTYSGTRIETLETYILSDPSNLDDAKLLDTHDLSTGLDAELVIDVEFPATGTYYIGFKEASKDPWAIYLFKSDIEQTEVDADDPVAPEAPANVTVAVQADGSRVISFDAVTKDIEGNDIEGIVYTVYRNDTPIADEITTSSYTDTDIVDFELYTYGVQAVFGELESEVAYAETMLFGRELDGNNYSTDFSGDHHIWTANTAEDTDHQWSYDEEGEYFFTRHADALLVTPPFSMTRWAKLSMETQGGLNAAEDEMIEVYLITLKSDQEQNSEESPELTGKRAPASDSKLILAFSLNGDKRDTHFDYIELANSGVYQLAFMANTNDAGTGVKLHSFAMETYDTPTGIMNLYTDGVLIYNRAAHTIMIPAEGTLTVYAINGGAVINVETAEHVDISNLVPGTYMARFVDREGKIATLKFVR